MQKKSLFTFKYFFITTIFIILTACNSGSNSSSTTPVDKNATPLVTVNDAQLMNSVDNITTFPTQLEPQIWNGNHINPEIRTKALAFANILFKQLRESDIVVTDVVTLGSLASYEYDQDADLDIHIFVDTSNYHGDVRVLKKYITQFNYVNLNKYHVSYYGYPAEFLVYAESASSHMKPGVGMYSLMTDTWLSPPVQNANNFNKENIFNDAKGYINQYNQLITSFNTNPQAFNCVQLNNLMYEMISYRTRGLTEDGIRSTANLTYRMLRRLNINMPDTLRVANDKCVAIHASAITN